MNSTGRRFGTARFYAGILWLPLSLTVAATVVVYYFAMDTSISRDTTVLGLLSQFDGTATTVFVALAAIRPSVKPAEYGTSSRLRRRNVQIRFAAAFALLSFVFATAGAHYRSLGAWAVALNVTTVATILWALAGGGDET